MYLYAYHILWLFTPCLPTLQMNHMNDFKHPRELMQALSQAWEEMIDCCIEPRYVERLVQVDTVTLEALHCWNESKNSEEHVHYLNKLVTARRDIVKAAMNFQAWATQYLPHARLQYYLKQVTYTKADISKDDSKTSKLLVRQLVKQSDVLLVKDLAHIFQRIYHTGAIAPGFELADFMILKAILNHSLEEMKSNSGAYVKSADEQGVRIKFTQIVAKAVKYMLNNYREANQKYEELFLVTLLFPLNYDTSEKVFPHLLSVCDLEYLCEEIDEQNRADFSETVKVQAYLFQTVVKVYNSGIVPESQTLNQLIYLQREILSVLNPHVGHALIQFHSSGYDWKDVQSQLAALIRKDSPQMVAKLLEEVTQAQTESNTPNQLDNPQDGEVENELSRADLDPKHWLPVFKKRIGVTSTQGLKYIGSESYANLEQFAQKPLERIALQNLLGMESKETSLNCKKQKETNQKRHENSQQMLQQLKELNEEGKDRNDSTVQQIENEICEALQIPTDSWIPQDEALQMVIGHLDTFIDQMDRTLATSDISDTLVVQNASGGHALQGIFLNRDLKEQLKSCAQLLKVPEGIRLVEPSLSQSELVKDFSSKSEEDRFTKSMDRLGYSATVAAKQGFWSFECSKVVSSAFSNSQEKATIDDYPYSSRVKYSFVPLASCYFSSSQLQLSKEAVKYLRIRIERLIMSNQPETSVQEKCKEFIRIYGSHATKGPLHFGAIRWHKSFNQGYPESLKSTVKECQINALRVKARLGIRTSCFLDRKTDFQGTYSDSLTSVTYVEEGGHPEGSSLLWKASLVASNSTWSLIDRGTDTVPVWEIIQVQLHMLIPVSVRALIAFQSQIN